MNPDLDALRPYPFERLAALLDTAIPAASAPPPDGTSKTKSAAPTANDGSTSLPLLKLSVGEPQHAPPECVKNALGQNLDLLARYPATRGSEELRHAQTTWLHKRYGVRADSATQVLPVNGTREALFAIAQTCVGHGRNALVGCPNPFYQIYEGAALLAGAETALIDTNEHNAFLPDPDQFTTAQWKRMQLLYICSPGNPNGAVMPETLLHAFIAKAQEHNVVLVSDECYSEIYPDEKHPPPGLLQACASLGINDFRNCISMHSLSKRSNLPGLRSGFAAGDAQVLAQFLRYRGYHGSAMPPHHQVASTMAWSDETHVKENRTRYREKFSAVTEILAPVLALNAPEGGFYLWPKTPIPDEDFARRLYCDARVVVLPGSYLGREGSEGNPGANRVRLALVAELQDCIEAAERIAAFTRTL